MEENRLYFMENASKYAYSAWNELYKLTVFSYTRNRIV